MSGTTKPKVVFDGNLEDLYDWVACALVDDPDVPTARFVLAVVPPDHDPSDEVVR